MTTWKILYAQTEYREMIVEADTLEEAEAAALGGRGDSSFVGTGDDARIVTCEEE